MNFTPEQQKAFQQASTHLAKAKDLIQKAKDGTATIDEALQGGYLWGCAKTLIEANKLEHVFDMLAALAGQNVTWAELVASIEQALEAK